MLEAQMKLPEALWGPLNLAWAGFFAVMGVLNLFVAYNFSEETWVNFKLFGGMGLMLVFVWPRECCCPATLKRNPSNAVRPDRRRRPGTLDKRLAARAEHVARLQALQADGRLILAGPCPAIDSPDPARPASPAA
jgi:hypothetical protein